MQFKARANYIRYSPFKLRPLVDVVRSKDIEHALKWLATVPLKRAVPIRKMLESAVANAKSLQNMQLELLRIKDIRVDHGPLYRYFKPGAMGRANAQRRRFSHMSVVLESVDKKNEAARGTKG